MATFNTIAGDYLVMKCNVTGEIRAIAVSYIKRHTNGEIVLFDDNNEPLLNVAAYDVDKQIVEGNVITYYAGWSHPDLQKPNLRVLLAKSLKEFNMGKGGDLVYMVKNVNYKTIE